MMESMAEEILLMLPTPLVGHDHCVSTQLSNIIIDPSLLDVYAHRPMPPMSSPASASQQRPCSSLRPRCSAGPQEPRDMTVRNVSIGNYNPMCCAAALADDGYKPTNT